MPVPVREIPADAYERALTAAAEGKSTTRVIAELGVSRTQFYRVLQRNASFERELRQARTIGRECLAESLLTQVEEDVWDTDPQRLKLHADNVKWYLAVQDPAKYGQRQTLTVESVDLGSALTEAKQRASRLINVTPSAVCLESPDPFD